MVVLKDGVPQVDFTLDQCQPMGAQRLPKWLRVTPPPPTGGQPGKVIMKLTLGKRIPMRQDIVTRALLPTLGP